MNDIKGCAYALVALTILVVALWAISMSPCWPITAVVFVLVLVAVATGTY